MSPSSASPVSSARPDNLHRYQQEVTRRDHLAARSLRQARAAVAEYEASCPDVAVTPPPLGAIGAALGRLRAFAAEVAAVGDAFEVADQSPGGAIARTTDEALARVVVDRFPRLANATILAGLGADLAEDVADDLERASIEDRTDLAEVRESVPAALATDAGFARAVLRRLGPDHLALLTQHVADATSPAALSPDLVWLGDLVARGSGEPDGSVSEGTGALLATRAGRNALRILRAASTVPLAPTVLRGLARALLAHPVRADRPPTHSPMNAFLEPGDSRVLQAAAHVPGLALSLLAGPDPSRPAHGRTARLVARAAGTEQRGVAALLEAALADPAATARDGALTPAGLEVVLGLISGVARVGHRATPAHRLSDDVLLAATRAVVAHPELVAQRTTSSEPAVERARVDEVTSALQHLAESPSRVALLTDGLQAARREAQVVALETGDVFGLELVGRLHGVLARAAERADVPRRPFDPLLDVAGAATLTGLAAAFGAKGSALGRAPVAALRDGASELLAEEPGTAALRLSQQMASTRELALLVVDHPPPGATITWVGSGLANRAELEALGPGEAEQAVVDQWLAAQSPAVHDALSRLETAYERGRTLPE